MGVRAETAQVARILERNQEDPMAENKSKKTPTPKASNKKTLKGSKKVGNTKLMFNF